MSPREMTMQFVDIGAKQPSFWGPSINLCGDYGVEKTKQLIHFVLGHTCSKSRIMVHTFGASRFLSTSVRTLHDTCSLQI